MAEVFIMMQESGPLAALVVLDIIGKCIWLKNSY